MVDSLRNNKNSFESIQFKEIGDRIFTQPFHSQSGRRVPCNFEDCLKTYSYNWVTIRILLCYSLPLYSNIASVGRSVRWITIGVRSLGNHEMVRFFRFGYEDFEAMLVMYRSKLGIK